MGTADIIASAASIIALLSLFVTIFEVRQSRSHSRASVRPVLELTWSSGKPTVGLMLKNVGLGPAIIYETRLFVDGQYIGKFNRENVNKVADDLTREICHPISKSTFGNNERVIEINFSRFIFFIENSNNEQREIFLDFLKNRFSVIFLYRSLYGEEAKASFGQKHLRSDQI